MRRVFRWMMLVVLCCAASVSANEASTDARLQEAQAAFDEATKLQKEGKHAEAIPNGEHALALRQAVLGDTHLEVAACLNLLGVLYSLQAAHDRAEPLLQRALAIREAALGQHHPEVATSLQSLATLLRYQGLYGQAEPLLQRALAIREAALGQHHPEVAASVHALAILYMHQGLYQQAEPLLQRALVMREAAAGQHHPLVASALNDLAQLYWNQGLYGQAEPLLQRALAIREAALGSNHPSIAQTLNSLAILYSTQGLYGQAEPLLQRALAIFESSLGKNHPDVAVSLNNLANVYSGQGLFSRAEPLHRRALAIREASLGQHHPHVATSLANLAEAYKNQGLYGQAAPLYQRALAIRETALGQHHPLVASALNGLAPLYLAQHRVDRALPLLTRAFSISEQRLRKEALDFSESRLAGFLQFLRTDEELLYALLRAHPNDAQVRRLALSSALLRKGRSVEETSNTSRTILRSLGAADRDTFERLRGLRTQLAQLSLQGPGALSSADYQQRLKDLADQGDALEADLARRSAPLRAFAALPPPEVMVDRVAAALPRDGALVEFVTYADRPLVPKPGTPTARLPGQLRYLALVLFPDARIRAIDLGPAAPIDQAASSLRNALALRDAAFQRPAQALYTVAFKPLLSVLGSTRRLLLAPDGQLGLVPFSALHDGKRFLIDTFDFSYLTSGKDLLPRPEGPSSSGSVVVLADPDFSSPVAAHASAQTPASVQRWRSASLERFYSTRRAALVEQAWAPLPGTRQEAEAIQRLIPQAQLLLGAEASKQHLLQLTAPGVLHIATHGFFLEDAAVATGSRGVAHLGSGGVPSQRPPDPLLRSGLVLSGVHAPTFSTQSTQPPADGALVTALELAGLDLWGTQLVVLSACDTGRGDVKLGQGVYGLRRALVTAGAETVVMSLWKVNDETTRQLMESYYRSLLEGRGRAAALRQAMLSLRERQPHPYAWAPFIALGRDIPLGSPTTLPVQPPPVTSEIVGAYNPLAEGIH